MQGIITAHSQLPIRSDHDERVMVFDRELDVPESVFLE
jgi:hypothetical protein